MLVEAAKAGLGVALVPEAFIRSELRLRTLVRVGTFALTASRAYYVVFEPNKQQDPAVQKFRTWLLQVARPGD